MAAALFRRGAGLCVRCIHRELCRVVWRPQTALFSSKPPYGKQPRITHIKKAKPQPALDVAKLLEQLFSQPRPGRAGKAQPTKASSLPPKSRTTSSVKVSTSEIPPSLKTEPGITASAAASTFNAAPLSPQPKPASPTNPATSETPQQLPLGVIQASAADSVSNVTVPPTSTTPAPIETNVEAAAEPVELKTATVETSVETTAESPVEPVASPEETLEGRASVVEAPVDAPAEEMQTEAFAKEEPLIETAVNFPAAGVESSVEPAINPTVDTTAENKSSGVGGISFAANDEPLLEASVEPLVEAGTLPQEILKSRAAAVEFHVDETADAAEGAVQTSIKDSRQETVEASVETTVEPSEEASTSALETLENKDDVADSLVETLRLETRETLETRGSVAEGSVETTIDAEADTAARAVPTNMEDSGVANVSCSAKDESLIETTVDTSLEASPLETPKQSDAVGEGSEETLVETEAGQAVQTIGEVGILSNTKEPALEASPAVSESTVDDLAHVALIQNAQESAPSPLQNEAESIVESSSGNVPVEDEVTKSEKMTLESVTLHVVEVQLESLEAEELIQTKSALDEKAEKELQELLVQTGTGAEYKAAAESESSSDDEPEPLNQALSKWDSLSDDLQELEGESGLLVNELLCHVSAVPSKNPATVSSASAEAHVGTSEESLQMAEEGSEAEAMTLDSLTLSKVTAEVGDLEAEALLETRNALEKEAEVLAKEKMEVETAVEDISVFENATEAEIITVDTISEATDAIEAETSVMLEAMFGSEQGPRQPPGTLLLEKKLEQQDEGIDQGAEIESAEQEGSVLEAMTLESVTLAEVEASLGTLEDQSMSETTGYLEKEAEILAGETKLEVEDEVATKETTEEVKIEFLPEVDALSELQTDALMEELLFSTPWHVTRVTEGLTSQKDVRANILDAEVMTGSVEVDSAAAGTDDRPAPPVLKEAQLDQEVEDEDAQTEALGNEDGIVTHKDLDPVQRLFLEKIREYNNMRRLKGGPLEAEPDYEKLLLQETAKLQRLYGGGDLSSFPEFTFTEPKMDQDSK